MPDESKASLDAVGAGCAVNLLCVFCGTGLGYLLMPAMGGGYYGALADAFWALLIWCGSGFTIGVIAGVLLAAKVARWVESRKSTGDKESSGGKDPN